MYCFTDGVAVVGCVLFTINLLLLMNEPIFGTGMKIDLFMGRARKCRSITDITAAVCVCVCETEPAGCAARKLGRDHSG